MTAFNALALESEIVVSLGSAGYDRRLTDKILAAFNHAYSDGELSVAVALRRALEEAEAAQLVAERRRRGSGALDQAQRWVEFVDARNAYRQAVADAAGDAEEARLAMVEAYRRWSAV